MRCPHDEAVLQMTERHGIEIDYCPTCRGVWLDRGELDKIIEKALVTSPPPPPVHAAPPGTAYPPSPGACSRHAGSPDSPDDRYGYNQNYGDPRYQQRRKRESFLGNLFDF